MQDLPRLCSFYIFHFRPHVFSILFELILICIFCKCTVFFWKFIAIRYHIRPFFNNLSSCFFYPLGVVVISWFINLIQKITMTLLYLCNTWESDQDFRYYRRPTNFLYIIKLIWYRINRHIKDVPQNIYCRKHNYKHSHILKYFFRKRGRIIRRKYQRSLEKELALNFQNHVSL